MTTLTILYATDDMTSRLTAARAARTWEVFCPATINEALGMAVYYAPHAVVIDGDSSWLNELALHLTNVTGPSARLHEVIVRIGETPLALDIPDFMSYLELPQDITPDALAHLLAALTSQRTSSDRAMRQMGAA